MTPQELQQRTFDFGLRAYEFCRPLLRNIETRHVGNQLIRAATSVAANNRAAGHARSRREFCSKIGTVREESDESLFWLDFIRAAKLATGQLVKDLAQLNAQRLARRRARRERERLKSDKKALK